MAGSPLFRSSITAPGEGVAERSMKMSAGSTTVDHASRNAFRLSRFFTTTCTGADGSGKRSDSWNVRVAVFASPVNSHSPKIEAKPRE